MKKLKGKRNLPQAGKKRGRKPGVKVGPYKKRSKISIADIEKATDSLKLLIKYRIKYLQHLIDKL